MLGYPRMISVESFRVPNVELVADILYWLTRRYEPSAEVIYDIEHESSRVLFFRQCCEAILSKGRLRLNIKKLYQADGHAVQELLRLAAVMRQAAIVRNEESGDYSVLQTQAAQKGHHDATTVQKLCTDLTNVSSSLATQVTAEIDTRKNRALIMGRATDVSDFNLRLRDMLLDISQQITTLNNGVMNMAADTSAIETKIESARIQNERQQKRLTAMLKIRPAYMEEYERFEVDLQAEFVKYLEHYRNLEYLESELSRYNSREDDLISEQDIKLKVLREKLRKEEMRVLHNASDVDDDDDDDDSGSDSDDDNAIIAAQKASMLNQNRTDTSGQRRPRAASGRERPPVPNNANAGGPSGAVQQSGSMFTTADDDDDDDDSSDDDSSDDDSSDDDSSDDDSSDDDSDVSIDDDDSDDDSDDDDDSDGSEL